MVIFCGELEIRNANYSIFRLVIFSVLTLGLLNGIVYWKTVYVSSVKKALNSVYTLMILFIFKSSADEE